MHNGLPDGSNRQRGIRRNPRRGETGARPNGRGPEGLDFALGDSAMNTTCGLEDKVGNHPFAVMFHAFEGRGHVHSQGSITDADLDRLIRLLGRGNLIHPDEWIARALRGTLRESDRCLSFDDSLKNQFDVALPVLDAHGLKAFWFVPTGMYDGIPPRVEIYRRYRTEYCDSLEAFYDSFLQRGRTLFADEMARLDRFEPGTYLSQFPFYSNADRVFRYVRDVLLGPDRYDAVMAQLISDRGLTLAELADGLWMTRENLAYLTSLGHVVGLHSHTHPTRLEDLSPVRQRYEYERNAAFLFDITGRRPDAVAHPCNSYSAETLRILDEMGVRVGFRSNTRVAPASRFELQREDHANLLRQLQPV